MTVPQMKERPASMLRAMFAGLGSLLGVVDKVRAKNAAQDPAGPETTAEPETTAQPEALISPETAAEPETTAEPEALISPETTAVPVTPAEPEATAVPVTPAEPETVVAPQATAAPETTAEPETGVALPVANYDELSVASLRARLRNLSVAQLTALLDYEKSHAARADIITMFERRIVKVQSES